MFLKKKFNKNQNCTLKTYIRKVHRVSSRSNSSITFRFKNKYHATYTTFERRIPSIRPIRSKQNTKPH